MRNAGTFSLENVVLHRLFGFAAGEYVARQINFVFDVACKLRVISYSLKDIFRIWTDFIG